MDALSGANISSALVEIASEAVGDANKLDTARAKLVLDTVRDAGSNLVKLLDGLGENIDEYV